MSDMIERVAKAMYELRPIGVREWQDCPTREACALRLQARAAIEASGAAELLEALKAVVRIADRKTVEFDAARAAIAKAQGTLPEPSHESTPTRERGRE